MHAYQFLSEQTKNILLDGVKDICRHQYILFSVLLNTNICIFENKNNGNKWKCTFDFESMIGKVDAITPVPGGVGPMTIMMLLLNTVKSAENANQ